MLNDLRHAVRMLLQTKGWTATVLVSLALGIGANTALFTAVNGLLLQTVALPDPESLVRIKWSGDNDMMRSSSDYGYSAPHRGQRVRPTVSHEVFRHLRAANETMTDLAASAPIGGLNVIVNGEAEIASSLGVSGNYFRTLQLAPAFGRLLTDEDDKPGAPPVGVLSHAFWRRRFGADPNISGRVVTINNQSVTIVGVTPATFLGTQRLGAAASEVTLPLSLDPLMNPGQTRMSQPTTWWLLLTGRLKPGETPERVRGNLEGVFQQTARAGMDAYLAGLTADERNLSTNRRETRRVPELAVSSGSRGTYDLDQDATRAASYLSVVSLVVLLIVCANVANLLLSRAAARQREISIRLSVGATRRRLVRQLLTESLLLAFVGGALGVLVGYWSRALLPFGQTVPMDWRVGAFAGGLSLVTGVFFGLVPAFRATRVDLAGAMKEQSRSVIASRTRLARALLVVQVGLSLVLVIGAGLFVRTLQNLREVEVGFNPNNLLMFSVNPQVNGYDADRSLTLYAQLQAKLATVPGVTSVAFTRVTLLSGSTSTTSLHVPGRSGEVNTHMMMVSPEFFETMQIPFVGGRGFTASDTRTSPKVVVINETAARALFPGNQPLGQRLGFSPEENREYEVVGIIRDTKYASVREPAPPTFYQLHAQGEQRGMTVLIRTAGDPAAMTASVRSAVREVDANLPITNVSTQIEQIERRFVQERLFANAYSLFGALALLLASIGLFGVMSYSVSRRTNEIGIRMALGAQRLQVARMVLSETLGLVALGIVLGLVATFAAGRLVTSVLFGLAATDAFTIVVAVAVVLAVSLVAGYLPARRATRVDPLTALR